MKTKYLILNCAFIMFILILARATAQSQLTGRLIDDEKSKCAFKRGDINNDDHIDISDALVLLNYLFKGGKIPICLDAADADDNGKVDLTDAIFLLNFLFQGGKIPPLPYPEKGIDPTFDELTCNINACSIKSTSIICANLGINQPCVIQVYEQTKTTEQGVETDIAACQIIKEGNRYKGCNPYETRTDKERTLINSQTEEINPTFYNRKQDIVISWEERKSGRSHVYLSYLNKEIKSLEDIQKNKIYIGEGSHPYLSNELLIYEDEEAILGCELDKGEYMCEQSNTRIILLMKNKESQKSTFPLIKGNVLLYREKEKQDELYACVVLKNKVQNSYNYECNPSLIANGKIDLPQGGDVSSEQGITYAMKNLNNLYDIYYSKNKDKKLIAQNQRLVNTPQIISLYNSKEKQNKEYIIWKNADPSLKYNIFIKSIENKNEPPITYKVITPGYTGAHDQILFNQQGFKFIQTKIIGKFKSTSQTQDQNFINEWFICDLTTLEKIMDDAQIESESNCLKKINI